MEYFHRRLLPFGGKTPQQSTEPLATMNALYRPPCVCMCVRVFVCRLKRSEAYFYEKLLSGGEQQISQLSRLHDKEEPVSFIWFGSFRRTHRYFMGFYKKADGTRWSCDSRSTGVSGKTKSEELFFRQWKPDGDYTVGPSGQLIADGAQTRSCCLWVNSSDPVDDFFFFIAESFFLYQRLITYIISGCYWFDVLSWRYCNFVF